MVLLVALVFGAFGGALQCGFVRFDDHGYVYENPVVAQGLTAAGVRWAFTTVWQQWWLPLLWISFMADVDVFGPGPWGHHLANLMLHAANAVLCFWFLYRATGARGRSWLAAALWAVHPLRVESVVWITERKDVLSGLFFFLALLAYLRYVRQPGFRHMAAVSAAMLAGLMSKATVIVLPALLLLLDYWPLRRAGLPWTRGASRRWLRLAGEKTPLFVLAAIFAVVNLHTHEGGAGTVAWSARLALMAGNVWTYLRLVFWPARLAFFYPENDVVAWGPALAALAGTLAVLAWLASQGRRRPWLLVGGLWFGVALLPILRGIRLGLAAYADRFTYLPAVGLTLAVVWGAGEIWERWRGRRLLRVMAGTLALALGLGLVGAARRQTETWRDSETLFRRGLAVTENNSVAHANLATCLQETGRKTEARAHLEAALAIKPDRADVLNNLAWVLATDPAATPEQAVRARDLARRAVYLAPKDLHAMLDTLAAAQAACGDYVTAWQTAEQARAGALAQGNLPLARRIETRMQRYRAGQPYRE